MEEQRYHCALCGLQSLRSAAARPRERFFSQRHRTVRCVRGVRVWPVSCKMSYECLRWYRCMRRALLDALKHLKKSISTTSTYETTRTASSRTCTTARSPSSDQDIKTSNFSPAAGLGPSRRPGRLKKCVLCARTARSRRPGGHHNYRSRASGGSSKSRTHTGCRSEAA